MKTVQTLKAPRSRDRCPLCRKRFGAFWAIYQEDGRVGVACSRCAARKDPRALFEQWIQSVLHSAIPTAVD